QGKPQKYGSQGQYRENKGLYMWPVEIPEKVNQLRKEAGFLTTIEEKAKEMDAIYDPELKLENF
ncbi:MAG: DoxX family rane protein, partial [Alphaproteobacteria bacterium]|nr:DoxX family rane protein [Alphaproteobacteria bacterium]